MSLQQKLEALILASDEPLSITRLRNLLGEDVPSDGVRTALAELEAHYAGRGIRLARVANGWQFRTAPEQADLVRQLWQTRPPRLSRSQLETLAIIAYRQPTTRAEIEALRGVRVSSSVMTGLQERGWVKVVGRKEVPGRPHLYGTSREFLVDFGLESLKDLPDSAQLMDEEELVATAEAEQESSSEADAEPRRDASGAGATGEPEAPGTDDAGGAGETRA